MPLIDCSFVDNARVLRLDCRVADGWRRAKRTYCFSEETRVPWQFDYVLKPRASLFPRPVTLAEHAREYRVVGKHSGGHTGVKFDLDSSKLRLDVALWLPQGTELNEHLPWHETHTKKPCIGWSDVVNDDSGTFTLDLLIVFDPPSSGPPPVVRDWFRRFYPGGLPSLGKKR